MTMFDIDDRVNKANPVIPNRIYINRLFAPFVNAMLIELMEKNLLSEIKTWDGAFCVRKKRGLASLSMHSWGIAMDLNAAHNPLGYSYNDCISKGLKPFSNEFIDVCRKYTDCGADWKRADRMHFQMKSLE